MNKRAVLRQLIERKEILVAPGAHDALSAKLAEDVGFEAVYMTGFGTSVSIFGLPDIGFLTMTEMVENARRMANAVSIPLIADADTGYGNHLNMMRTVEEYERAGIAGIQIEDQVAPKRCGHMEGKTVVPAEEMTVKIRAAVKARQDKDMLIIARTDAIAVLGFDEAIRRGNMYRDAGADIVFIEAPTSIEQLESIPKLIKNAPVLVNIAPKTPYLPVSRYDEMGYAIAIYPPLSITTAYRAIREELMELKKEGMTKHGVHGGVPFDEFLDFLRLKHFRDLEEEILKG
jgi:2-methylisocitrate lyase-like PEP mutase family enzyme